MLGIVKYGRADKCMFKSIKGLLVLGFPFELDTFSCEFCKKSRRVCKIGHKTAIKIYQPKKESELFCGLGSSPDEMDFVFSVDRANLLAEYSYPK